MPENKEKSELLKKAIDERISTINSKRKFYRLRAFSIYIATVLLSAATTVLLGLNITEFSEATRVITLVINTVITVISSYNLFFSYKELWVSNNMALNKFYQLRFALEFTETGQPEIDTERLTQFKDRYQEILDELNGAWQKNRINQR